MPLNKDAYTRYLTLDSCLRNKQHKFPTKDFLVRKCCEILGKTISPSTIEKDLIDMRENGGLNFLAPIAYDRYHRGYYYTQEGYSISEFPMEIDDLRTIQFVGAIAELFGDLSELRQFQNIVNRLTDYFRLGGLMEKEDLRKFISLEQSNIVQGKEWIEPILRAVKNSFLIKVKHQKFLSEKPKEHLLQPYLLKEFRERWYLLAKGKGENGFLTFGLDRIKECEIMSGEKFTRDKGFNPEKFYEHAFGIIAGDDSPVEIHLAFRPLQAEYVLSQPLHHSQKIISVGEKETIIKLYLGITHDFIMQLLSYGGEVKVLKPKRLVKRIRDEIEVIGRNYKEMS